MFIALVYRVGPPEPSHRRDDLLRQLGVDVVPVSGEHAKIGRDAYSKYGKGSGHRAQLNFGDCFAFALAVSTFEPLLCKGDDFIHTGIRLA